MPPLPPAPWRWRTRTPGRRQRRPPARAFPSGRWRASAEVLQLQVIPFQPAVNLHAALVQRTGHGGDVALVLAQERDQLLAAPLILGRKRGRRSSGLTSQLAPERLWLRRRERALHRR